MLGVHGTCGLNNPWHNLWTMHFLRHILSTLLNELDVYTLLYLTEKSVLLRLFFFTTVVVYQQDRTWAFAITDSLAASTGKDKITYISYIEFSPTFEINSLNVFSSIHTEREA